jgi:hypothetical protein
MASRKVEKGMNVPAGRKATYDQLLPRVLRAYILPVCDDSSDIVSLVGDKPGFPVKKTDVPILHLQSSRPTVFPIGLIPLTGRWRRSRTYS